MTSFPSASFYWGIGSSPREPTYVWRSQLQRIERGRCRNGKRPFWGINPGRFSVTWFNDDA